MSTYLTVSGKSFNQFAEQQKENVLRYLRKHNLASSWWDVEDAYQDSLMVLVDRINKEGQMDPDEAAKVLCGICKHVLLDSWKPLKDKMFYSTDDEELLFNKDNFKIYLLEGETDEDLKQRRLLRLNEALQQLSSREQEILSMYYGLGSEELSQAEIALRLGYPSVDTVKTLKCRAFKKLKALMQDNFPKTAA